MSFANGLRRRLGLEDWPVSIAKKCSYKPEWQADFGFLVVAYLSAPAAFIFLAMIANWAWWVVGSNDRSGGSDEEEEEEEGTTGGRSCCCVEQTPSSFFTASVYNRTLHSKADTNVLMGLCRADSVWPILHLVNRVSAHFSPYQRCVDPSTSAWQPTKAISGQWLPWDSVPSLLWWTTWAKKHAHAHKKNKTKQKCVYISFAGLSHFKLYQKNSLFQITLELYNIPTYTHLHTDRQTYTHTYISATSNMII